MLIKAADDKQPYIAALEALLLRPDVDGAMRARIDQDVRMAVAGWRAERDAAYEIEFHFGSRPSYATIHDLRIEFDGQVAQIDHLVINRLLQVWVCEAKSYNSGVSINEHGEWTTRWNGRTVGLPSPIEQNRRHLLVLQRLFDADVCPLPRRLGQRLTPDLRSLVVVANTSRITRPRSPVDGLSSVIKAEKLRSTIEAQFDQRLRGMLRVITQAELERLATDLAALHRPLPPDVESRYGLGPIAPAAAAPPRAIAGQARPHPPCQRCGRTLTKQEAWFCRFNKARFAGGFYCIDCQDGAGSALWRRRPEARPPVQPGGR